MKNKIKIDETNEETQILSIIENLYFRGEEKRKKPLLLEDKRYLELKEEMLNKSITRIDFMEKVDKLFWGTPTTKVSSPIMVGSLESKTDINENHFSL